MFLKSDSRMKVIALDFSRNFSKIKREYPIGDFYKEISALYIWNSSFYYLSINKSRDIYLAVSEFNILEAPKDNEKSEKLANDRCSTSFIFIPVKDSERSLLGMGL